MTCTLMGIGALIVAFGIIGAGLNYFETPQEQHCVDETTRRHHFARGTDAQR